MPINKMEYDFDIPETVSRANAGAYRATPIYNIICSMNATEPASRVAFPNLLSKYCEREKGRVESRNLLGKSEKQSQR